MNRRIGRLIQVGLFAALPATWVGTALAQNTNSGVNSAPSDTQGINPLPQSDTSGLGLDQTKKGHLDDSTPAPMGTDQKGGDLKGSTDVNKTGQPGSETKGSPGSSPSGVDTKDIQKQSGTDQPATKDFDSGLDKGDSVMPPDVTTPAPKSDIGTQNSDTLKDSTDINK